MEFLRSLTPDEGLLLLTIVAVAILGTIAIVLYLAIP
jgi:hypothetical protein